MKGETVKRKLEAAGFRTFDKDFSTEVGIKKTVLERLFRSNDVKSSHLERIIRSLELPKGFFFMEKEQERKALGDIVVCRDPFYINQSQYELNVKLKEGETLKYLAIASIKDGEAEVIPIEKYRRFHWHNKGEGATIFFLFLDNERGLIRYFDENDKMFEEFVDKNNFRITLEYHSGFQLCLYKNKEELSRKSFDFDFFDDAFDYIWSNYMSEAYLKYCESLL